MRKNGLFAMPLFKIHNRSIHKRTNLNTQEKEEKREKKHRATNILKTSRAKREREILVLPNVSEEKDV